MTRPRAGDPCPGCSEPLQHLATRCWAGTDGCGWTLAEWKGAPGSEPRNTLRPADKASARVPDHRSEKEIQHAIRTALELSGFRCWDTSQPFAAAITPGLPDLVFIGHGIVGFCEVKGPKGKATPAQAEFIELVGENGGIALLWRDETEAIEWIRSVLGGRAA